MVDFVQQRRELDARCFAAVTLMLAICTLLGGSASAAPGDLDRSLSGDGIATTDFGRFESATDVAVQPDGRIVTVGTSWTGDSTGGSGHVFALSRHNRDGSLDASFSGDGTVTTAFSNIAFAQAVALQPDRRILVAGQVYGAPGYDIALARYNPDGSLDHSFSGDGIQSTDLGASAGGAYDVALQSDGRILVVGNASAAGFTVTRFHADGSLDTSFSGDGTQTAEFGTYAAAYGVAVQSDGKIVSVGTVGPCCQTAADFGIVRYNRDGSLDTSFSGDGKQTTDFGNASFEGAMSVALQPDGRIVAGGSAGDFAVARYLADGSLDTSFSADGKQTTDFGGIYDGVSDVAIDPAGRIVAVGRSQSPGFAVARYDADGSLDTSFSGDGRQTASLGGGTDGAGGGAVQPDGAVVAAGGFRGDFMLARIEGYDPAPPETTIDSEPAGPIHQSERFGFSSSKPRSSFECRIDAGAFGPCSSPSATGALSAGKHAFEVRAIDEFGRVDATAARRTFKVLTCTITGTVASERLTGTPGADVICGLGGNDTLLGMGGNDVLFGDDGDDLGDGGAGADVLSGGEGHDRVSYSARTARVVVTVGGGVDDGEAGEQDDVQADIERVYGGTGDDRLTGDASGELLDGGPGADELYGMGGKDFLDGGPGPDVLSGGEGSDLADYATRTIRVVVTIGTGNDDGAVGERDDVRSDIERVRGGSANDRLTGSPAADVLDGGAGDDELQGLSGIDTFLAGEGDDNLLAIDGLADTLSCGAGTDTIAVDPQDIVAADCSP